GSPPRWNVSSWPRAGRGWPRQSLRASAGNEAERIPPPRSTRQKGESLDTTLQRAEVSAPASFPAPDEPSACRAELDWVVAGVASAPPFFARLGLPGPSAWEYGRVVAEFSAPPDTTAIKGVVFGGYIASLIDQQAALALMSVVPDGTILLTRRLEMEFLA